MNGSVNFRKYLEQYANTAKIAKSLGHEDMDGRRKELNEQIKNAEKKINEITNVDAKEFEKMSKKYMEIIKNSEKEIEEIDIEKVERAENINKDEEIKAKYQEKNNIVNYAKAEYETAKKVREAMEKNAERPLIDKKKEKQNFEKQLKDMLDMEAKEPKKVKNTKYKEFLDNKIKALDEEIKNLEPKINEKVEEEKNKTKILNDNYRKFLLNIGKIDRGEELLPMSDDIKHQKDEEDSRKNQKEYNKAWDEAIKENKARDEYNKAWDEAIEENKARDEYNKAWDEAIEENKARDEYNKAWDEAIEENKEYDKNKKPDIEIALGRKGKVSYKGKTYKISKKMLKNISSLDKNDIIEIIENAGIDIENEEKLEKILDFKTTDYTVIKGICSAKNMNKSDRRVILQSYLKDCTEAMELKEFKNLCDVKYDLKDLSKAGGMNEFDKYDFLQRAKKAERFNVGKQEGEFKPTWFAKLIGKFKGENLKKLAEKNQVFEIENATAVNRALDKDNNEKGKEFIESLKENKKVNLGKGMRNTKLDHKQISEIKDVYAQQTKEDEESIR